jgi:hypothetical protein
MCCSFIANIVTLSYSLAGKTKQICVRFEFLTQLLLKIKIFWFVMLRHRASSFLHYKEPKCLHLKGHMLDTKDESTTILRTTCWATQCHISEDLNP